MHLPALDNKLGNDEWIKSFFLGNGSRPGNNKTHWNRWCKRCLEVQVESTLQEENRRYTARELNVVRTPETIQNEILANPTTAQPKPVVSKLEVLIKHLVVCKSVTDDVNSHAALLKEHRYPSKSKGRDKENCPSSAGRSPFPANRVSLSGNTTPRSATPRGTPVGGGRLARTDTQLLPHGAQPATPLRSSLSTSSTSSGPGSSTLGKRRLSESVYTTYLGIDEDPLQFPPALREEYQTDFCKLLLSGNCAFRLAELPYWQHFFRKWIPGAPTPSRYTLGGRILDEEAGRVLESMKTHLQGRYGTGQSDGWKTITKASIIASMVNAEYEPHILHSHDVSEQAKTAENLLKIVEAEIKFCEEVLKIILAAWCTDGGGDCNKMRRLLREKRPDLATPHCWSHQVRLVVGDYLKAKTPVISVLDVALELIKWFNNHSGALAVLREEQMRQYGRIRALIRPAPTRWTAHYLSASRLLEVEMAMRVCAVNAKSRLLVCAGRERAQVDKARELLEQIEQPLFWANLREARSHLEPLAIAANATQGDNARLDIVLTTLGTLFLVYSDTERFDDTVRSIMHRSLEMRWKNAGIERDLYLLAIVLNPYLRLIPLRKNNPLFTRQGLWQMLKRCYERTMQQPADNALHSAFLGYLNEVGEWSRDGMGLDLLQGLADSAGKAVNLIDVWRGIDTQDSGGANALVKFALRLFAIVPNSAGVERLFSLLGIIQTKLRNRLGVEKSRRIVLVKSDINRTYGSGRQEQHREFNAHPGCSDTPAASSSNAPTPVVATASLPPLPVPGSLASNSDATISVEAVEPTPDPVLDSEATTFHAVAAELFELVAEDRATSAEDSSTREDGLADVLQPPAPAGSTGPPRSGLPVPRGAASYELKWLFEYPASISLETAPGTSNSNPLTSFWHYSVGNLGKELTTYDISISAKF